MVTEISYHTAPTINADVLFLSEAEWREEIVILLDDIKAEGSNLKRTTDLHGDIEVAWHKVRVIRFFGVLVYHSYSGSCCIPIDNSTSTC